ncbi:hypothetical protein Pcinc_020249 [Petrolisthes cinctipes]|uniref:Uncharacterized protein n=1 Tax=Petrolisthes cinctipes TaxID=88211 RepID=A0AAE1FIL5_PETCI|nr:hypothetical protein Pcinc_020249 [Petrolisthes cinctipes]
MGAQAFVMEGEIVVVGGACLMLVAMVVGAVDLHITTPISSTASPRHSKPVLSSPGHPHLPPVLIHPSAVPGISVPTSPYFYYHLSHLIASSQVLNSCFLITCPTSKLNYLVYPSLHQFSSSRLTSAHFTLPPFLLSPSQLLFPSQLLSPSQLLYPSQLLSPSSLALPPKSTKEMTRHFSRSSLQFSLPPPLSPSQLTSSFSLP